MFEQDGMLVVEVGLPGVRFADVSVRVQGAHLVIAARRPQAAGERRYHLRGRRVPRESVHEVMLPPHACPDQATATYAQGLLRVCIPLGSEDSSAGTPIPVKDPLDVRAGGEAEGARRRGMAEKGEGSPTGAETVKGGAVSVPGSGIPSQERATLRRCALCNAWMDGAGAAEPPPAVAPTRIRYDLCPACVPIDRKRDT